MMIFVIGENVKGLAGLKLSPNHYLQIFLSQLCYPNCSFCSS